MDALGDHDSATECCTGAEPVPVRDTMSAPAVALLITVMLPVTLPLAAGANVTLRAADCPGRTGRDTGGIEARDGINSRPFDRQPRLARRRPHAKGRRARWCER